MSLDKRIDDLKVKSLRSYRRILYDCLNSLCERDLIALSDIIIEKREKN
jgi:hypothetical protein